MIPIKLQIKNFLSYGSEAQTIDFEPYKLICLSGKNGHGKSALLDAITWALWGQARKISGTSKADEGLLKIGQSHMFVALDFEFNHQKYRVKRQYGITAGKPCSDLDFGVYDKNNNLISLNEKRIRLTQKKIEDTMSLTLDTFVNSAFLRQGQSNEFSKKSPQDRKDVFAQILGLQKYDFVKKLANDKARLETSRKEQIIKFQEKIELELQKKNEIKKQIEEINKNIGEILKTEKYIAQNQKSLDSEIKKLTEDCKNYQIIKFKLGDLANKENEKREKLLEIRTKWKEIHKQKLNLPEQKSLKKERINLIEKINKYQQVLQKKLTFKEKQLKIKEELQSLEKTFGESYRKDIEEKKFKIEKLNFEIHNINKNFKELVQSQLDKDTQKKEISSQINKLRDNISINSINKIELEKQEKIFDKRKEYYQKYITNGNWIKKELDALKKKQTLSQDEGNPSCPLCEQNLSASRKKFLKAKFVKQEKFYTHRFSRLSKIIKSLKQKLIDQHGVIKKLKKSEEETKTNKIKIEELSKKSVELEKNIENTNIKIKEIKEKQNNLCKEIETSEKDLKNTLKEGNKKLDQNTEYKALLQNEKNTNNELKKIEYDQQKHKLLSDELKKIENQITKYEKIMQEISLQESRKKNIQELCINLKKIKKEKTKLDSELLKYKDIEQQKKDCETKRNLILQEIKKETKKKEFFLQNKGALENQIEKLNQLEDEYTKQKKYIEKINQEIQDYKIIAGATGKDGIQAFLIENAIPEVEQEANNILSRLTNNQAQIFIESLRDLKKGGTKETLDIKISDSAGIRQYELFSGGESFRIDFALRIAISKLLARRAGTALQTLIIDEGFGSQDDEGLSKIMDAIYKIQDDFSKVIIVSHLSTMKDQFPVHFFIQKGPQGSSIKVIEQG